ncbi:hypothetical protein ACI2JA_03670 [Alkalihalobacillus sp. NPDC078783]
MNKSLTKEDLLETMEHVWNSKITKEDVRDKLFLTGNNKAVLIRHSGSIEHLNQKQREEILKYRNQINQ